MHAFIIHLLPHVHTPTSPFLDHLLYGGPYLDRRATRAYVTGLHTAESPGRLTINSPM